ncbi:sugar ABC transporter ATP-binding protein [Paenibacillus eucommiae]|uniref:Inositol transport system ATP-binding protein n=1 Tax=Paenibacillus eucommiae TaxID=1355755 RepID=A0ABS4J8A8_9BACL|nr:sugar ABC transporter ATP-binding protein [Paenibacillus eucommiae]MBP1996087.1 inositol transport system ATP-binding protein [Paenibacillus eucommiae]
MTQEYMLQMKDISKTFPGVKALSHVNLSIKKGSVHALMGENGAGKSTLMKILIGLYTDYAGEIYFKGQKIVHKDIKSALNAGIAMIHQELTYVPEMTVGENLFLGNEPRHKFFGMVDTKTLHKRTNELLGQIGVQIDPDVLMKDLSVSKRQMVEIAKAVSYKSELIIMDEPTSAIPEREVESLFRIIRELKDKGVSIIYISHKMDEIYRIADEFTVLRDGTYVGTHSIQEADENKMISMMVGRQLSELFVQRTPTEGPVVLSVKDLTRQGKFENISFDLRKGEILGLAGLMGAGRTELVSCIYGLDKADSGEIHIKNKKVSIRKANDGIQHGVGLVSEDRKTLGLVLGLSVTENLMLPNYKQLNKSFLISDSKERDIADRSISDLNIKTPSREQKVKNLSGGNQQKIVIGKVLLSNPDILILDEPTRGIDIGAKSEIYKLISQLASEGKAIIVVSSELPEVMGLADRILVLHEGKVAGQLMREEASEEKIMALAFGKHKQKQTQTQN